MVLDVVVGWMVILVVVVGSVVAACLPVPPGPTPLPTSVLYLPQCSTQRLGTLLAGWVPLPQLGGWLSLLPPPPLLHLPPTHLPAPASPALYSSS